jgi:hypothetical protein
MHITGDELCSYGGMSIPGVFARVGDDVRCRLQLSMPVIQLLLLCLCHVAAGGLSRISAAE